jgi:hypothetical protein
MHDYSMITQTFIRKKGGQKKNMEIKVITLRMMKPQKNKFIVAKYQLETSSGGKLTWEAFFEQMVNSSTLLIKKK